MAGSSGMGLSDGSTWHAIPYSANTWYDIKLNINWSTKTVDYYVNGTLAIAGITFRTTTTTALNDISLYNFNGGTAWWDDISMTTGSGSGYVASGNLLSAPVSSGAANWGTLTFSTSTPAQTAATVDILNSNGTLLAANVPSGTNLTTLGIAPGTIRLRANLSTSNAAVTSSLLNWSLGWGGTVNFDSAFSNTVSSTQVAPLTTSFKINDGSAQRSMVNSLSLTFNTPITLQPGAVTLIDSFNNPIPFTLATSDNITWTLSFSGSQFVGGSLGDGRYSLAVHSSLVTDGVGQNLAGGDQLFNFARLFGDLNGDGYTDSIDYLSFRNAYGKSLGQAGYIAPFDYDGNGTIDANDNNAFRLRLGKKI